MTRIIVDTPNAPQSKVPISQAVRSGNLLFVSGITPFTLDLKIAMGDFDGQMRQAMENLREILKAAGTDFDRVLKCTVLLANIEDWRRMTDIYSEYWPSGNYPARTAYGVTLPHPDFLIEVECVAEVG